MPRLWEVLEGKVRDRCIMPHNPLALPYTRRHTTVDQLAKPVGIMGRNSNSQHDYTDAVAGMPHAAAPNCTHVIRLERQERIRLLNVGHLLSGLSSVLNL